MSLETPTLTLEETMKIMDKVLNLPWMNGIVEFQAEMYPNHEPTFEMRYEGRHKFRVDDAYVEEKYEEFSKNMAGYWLRSDMKRKTHLIQWANKPSSKKLPFKNDPK